MPERILFVCHTHPNITQGGAEIVAHEEFRRAGADGWLLVHDAGRLPLRPGAPLTQPWGPREYVYAGRSFNHFTLSNPDPNFADVFGVLLEELKPDVVRFHHILGIGTEALGLAKRLGDPAPRVELVLHEYLLICHHYGQMVKRPSLALCHRASPADCHRCFPEESPQHFALRELWMRRFLAEVDIFICPSEFLRTRFADWGLPPERMVVRENLLPPVHETPPTSPSTIPRIGFFGQMSELKGIGVLVRAARILQGLGWPGVIDVYGSAEAQPTALQDRLDRILADPPSNMLIRGRYENAEVSALMATCNAVVVPSIWWENSPLVIQEAIRAGRPVIGSDIGGIKEKVLAAPRGALFKAGDPVSLAEAIVKLPSTAMRDRRAN